MSVLDARAVHADRSGARRAPRRHRSEEAVDGSRYWMVIDPVGELVCLTGYKQGAMEVVRRLGG